MVVLDRTQVETAVAVPQGRDCTGRQLTGLADVPGGAVASCRACVGSSAAHQLDTPAVSLLTLKSSASPAAAPPPPPKSCTDT